MKKQLMIIGITLFLFAVGLNGCTDEKNVSLKLNEEKILGRWTAKIPDTPLTVIMNFLTNMSYYESINETIIWGTYEITDETITLQSGGLTHIVEYSFSNNDNILILLETGDGGVFLVLTRR